MTAYETLHAAVLADRVQIGVDIRRMNSQGSPVFNLAENTVPVLLALVLTFALHAAFSMWAGAAVLVVFLAVWIGVILPRIRSRVYDRTLAMAMRDERHFTVLWAWGAVFLHRDGAFCHSPKGDWAQFVQTV